MNEMMDLTTSPFRFLREQCGLSGSEMMRLAADADGKPLSRTTLIYIEQGLYAALPPRPVVALLTACVASGLDYEKALFEAYGYPDIHLAHIHWQKAVRASLAERVWEAYQDWLRTPADSEVSPIYSFADQFGTVDRFAKSLKVPTGPLSRYLDGELHMPVALHVALTDAGLTEHQVDSLDDAHRAWLDLRRVPA